ncbi:MAG: DEAD/DEAH box helicase, partial [Anaerolineae bacterium]
MEAILHGTWVVDDYHKLDGMFFVWAERRASLNGNHSTRIRRHPYAATTIEIAHILAKYVPEVSWHTAERMTRVVRLPSWPESPVVPSWLDARENTAEDEVQRFTYWRLEGIGVSALTMLDVLAALPLVESTEASDHLVGIDLHFWSLAAKFVLELLAGQRYVPGFASQEQELEAVWLPMMTAPFDKERFTGLANAMPPVCRSVVRETGGMDTKAPEAPLVLQSFIGTLVNQAVKAWAGMLILPEPGRKAGITDSWWSALWANDNRINVPSGAQRDLAHFYQDWQSWTLRSQAEPDTNFSICLRLEPPEYKEPLDPQNNHWVLRYFIQSKQDPSLLVPANEVWSERGQVLSYLNHTFDQPQEKLLEGLGIAARVCPPIQRSLLYECPEKATLSAEEAYTFLRETARLLEGTGITVLVPPWWSRPEARLRVQLKMHAPPDMQGSGMLGMNSLVSYDWQLALGDELITREEFERLAALKAPLVQMRGHWVLLQPDQVEAAIAFWEKQQTRGELALQDALSLALGAEDQIDGLAVGDVDLDPWLSEITNTITDREALQPIPNPEGFVGELRPYQERGVAWLAFLGRHGLGACLADDMGLGKTIQAIALLLYTKSQQSDLEPALLICPTSLVGNWQREVERFAPGLKVVVHHGAKRAEGEELESQVLAADLVISTYGLARRDIESLKRIQWGHVILDEAQNIKNPVTKQARAIRRLQGKRRIVLTGTPIENRLSELWSLISFLNPGYLGSLDGFRRSFTVPIERFQDEKASERLRRLVRPF